MGVVLGITGCIGSGKSSLSALFVEKGFLEIDVDLIGKSVLQLPRTKESLSKYFPHSVFDANGNVIPKMLGKIVFTNPYKLKKLNSIMHPIMKNEVEEIILQNKDKNIIIHAALLYQMNLEKLCNATLYLSVKTSLLVQRALERHIYLNKQELVKLIKTQKKANNYINNAEIVVNNNFNKEKLIIKFNRLYSLFKEA